MMWISPSAMLQPGWPTVDLSDLDCCKSSQGLQVDLISMNYGHVADEEVQLHDMESSRSLRGSCRVQLHVFDSGAGMLCLS